MPTTRIIYATSFIAVFVNVASTLGHKDMVPSSSFQCLPPVLCTSIALTCAGLEVWGNFLQAKSHHQQTVHQGSVSRQLLLAPPVYAPPANTVYQGSCCRLSTHCSHALCMLVGCTPFFSDPYISEDHLMRHVRNAFPISKKHRNLLPFNCSEAPCHDERMRRSLHVL